MLKLIKKIITQDQEEDVFRVLPEPMIIAVDFDGTCVTEKYPEIGDEMPGCVATLKALVERGHKLVLWTCRERGKLANAVLWFEDREIPLVGINETPVSEDFRPTGGRKVFANIYIDDKAFGGFPGWQKIHQELLGMPLML